MLYGRKHRGVWGELRGHTSPQPKADEPMAQRLRMINCNA